MSAPIPSEIVLDNNVLPLYTFEQLDLDKRRAKNFATALRDKLGGFAKHLPPLPLSGSNDAIVSWLLNAQCAICNYAGHRLTPQSFGAPPGFRAAQEWAMERNGPALKDVPNYSGLETPYGVDSDINVGPAAQRRPLGIAPGI